MPAIHPSTLIVREPDPMRNHLGQARGASRMAKPGLARLARAQSLHMEAIDALAFQRSMIFSEYLFPLFRIML